MADYLAVAITVFAINVIPAFMPPTWVVLALAMANDSSLNPLALTLIGALSSTGGRAALAYLSFLFRRFFPQQFTRHADEARAFLEKKGNELFIGTFLYSLSPFPSNLIFIAEGFTRAKPKTVFLGFFTGRLISYYVLIALSMHFFRTLSEYFKSDLTVTYLFDIIGLLAAFSVLLVDWKKLMGGSNAGKNKRGEKSPGTD